MSQYPRSSYHFSVEAGTSRMSVSEVSGLTIELDVIEHTEGGDPEQTPRKMPGRRKFSNIVLKRGVIAGDNDFFQWLNTARLNTVERRDVIISLLDEAHQPVVSWRARNAFPCKYSGPDLKAGSSDVAIESLELAHEGLSLVE